MSAARLEGARLLASPLAAALPSVVRERGYRSAGIDEILLRAGVDRDEFEREFAGKDDLTLRLFEAIAADFRSRVGAAFESSAVWPENLRAAAWEMARWILDNPEAIWFGMVGVLDAGDMVLARREELFRWCVSLVESGRSAAPAPEDVPAQAALIAVGAIVEMLRRREDGSSAGAIVDSVPQMMYGAVRPYMGEEAARRELAIVPPSDLRARERGA